ncbi:c-type cytochrome [Vibrio maerlii]|uniref:c-type cytochrome n=1 Tax=Vibrio maerlii TaxID=2231648 RepID=UPI003B84B076
MLLVCLVFTTFSATQSIASAGNPELGKVKAPSCIYCHNPNGRPSQTDYPNINGQDALYLFNAMKAYQQGLRSGAYADMMAAQLRHLNDEDLKDIAAFYAQSGQ